VDLRLGEGRLLTLAPSSSGQQVELMTVTAGAVAGAGVAGIDPESDAVGEARPVGVALWWLPLAAYLDLHPEAQLIPRKVDLGKGLLSIHYAQVIQPA
jgi:hypothetical protein